MFLKKAIAIAVTASACILTPVQSYAAEAGDWLVRGRIINVNPNDDSSAVSGIAGSGVSVDTDTTVELDFTYFVDQNWALELILATTTHHVSGEGSIAGLGEIADAGVLPPTLTLQYHTDLNEKVSAYAGLGVNYTLFYSEDGKGPFEGADVDMDSSFGLSAQVGLDYDLNDDWFFNVDLKYVQLDTTAEIRPGDGSVLSVDVDIDPWIFGIGIGTKF